MTEPRWDFRNEAHLATFTQLLAPLVIASRSRDFLTPEGARSQLAVWIMALDDVPEDVLGEGVKRLMRVVDYMPRPGQLRSVCCDITDERRRQAAKRARLLRDNCELCEGIGWRFDTDTEGVEVARPCVCQERAVAMMRDLPPALERPALPPAEPVEA